MGSSVSEGLNEVYTEFRAVPLRWIKAVFKPAGLPYKRGSQKLTEDETMSDWQKSGWRQKPRVQMPDYTDADRLHAVEAQLAKYPPLVFAGEARTLKRQLGAASRGEAFLLRRELCRVFR